MRRYTIQAALLVKVACGARRTGRTKRFYARELIGENLEDLEDRYIAAARLEKRRTPLTSRQARKVLGLKPRRNP